jgi:hypothetical protein
MMLSLSLWLKPETRRTGRQGGERADTYQNSVMIHQHGYSTSGCQVQLSNQCQVVIRDASCLHPFPHRVISGEGVDGAGWIVRIVGEPDGVKKLVVSYQVFPTKAPDVGPDV